MARLPRLSIAGLAHHVIQRGHNRQPIFLDDEDRLAYLAALRESAALHRVAVHAYVLMLGGMLSGTGLAVFFVPIFFVVIRGRFRGSERQRKLHAHEMPPELPAGATAGDQV